MKEHLSLPIMVDAASNILKVYALNCRSLGKFKKVYKDYSLWFSCFSNISKTEGRVLDKEYFFKRTLWS